MATDGSVNRHGGTADMESNADERARERAEAVEERMRELMPYNGKSVRVCPECEERVLVTYLAHHLRECELLRARAEAEVDRG